MSVCQFPNCSRFVRDGKYCPGHAKIMRSSAPAAAVTASKPVKDKSAATRKKPIAKRNKAMSKKIRVLKKEAIAFLALPGNQVCAIQSPVCTHVATVVNHKAGRVGKKLLDTKYMQPSCAPCNGWIEDNDANARDNGHKVSRLTN